MTVLMRIDQVSYGKSHKWDLLRIVLRILLGLHVFGGEDHRDKLAFTYCYFKYTYYQHDLGLLRLTLGTTLNLLFVPCFTYCPI